GSVGTTPTLGPRGRLRRLGSWWSPRGFRKLWGSHHPEGLPRVALSVLLSRRATPPVKDIPARGAAPLCTAVFAGAGPAGQGRLLHAAEVAGLGILHAIFVCPSGQKRLSIESAHAF